MCFKVVKFEYFFKNLDSKYVPKETAKFIIFIFIQIYILGYLFIVCLIGLLLDRVLSRLQEVKSRQAATEAIYLFQRQWLKKISQITLISSFNFIIFENISC